MQALFRSFIFYRLIASGSMVFSAVSMFAFSFEADDGTGESRITGWRCAIKKRLYASLSYIDAVRSDENGPVKIVQLS